MPISGAAGISFRPNLAGIAAAFVFAMRARAYLRSGAAKCDYELRAADMESQRSAGSRKQK
jgi:hypothetical protein